MKICILGGGISGLSAAWFFHKQHSAAKITLFEKGPAVGGWIQTRQNGPFSFELGPRTFQTNRSKELLQLIDEVGLSGDLLHSSPAARKRFLLKKGHLASMSSFFPRLAAMICKDLFAKKGDGADESIESFATRRFGEKAAWQFFDPMALGVYAGDIRRLSVKSCFPFLLAWERQFRSVTLGALRQKGSKDGSLFTLVGGMHRLCEAICRLVPMDLHLNAEVKEMCVDGVVAGGHFYEADLIVCALPAGAAAKLLGEACPVRMESLEVVNLGYFGDVLPKKGYGYLVPTQENEKILGMIWDSCIFPVEGQTKVTAMVRGSDAVAIALDAMRRHCHVERSPDATGHTKAEVPQYDVGHEERIGAFEAAVKAKWPRVRLLGNYLHGASVNGCIKSTCQMS